MTPEDQDFAPAPCCACGVVGSHRNILQLGVHAPLPGRGWGCVVCGLPNDGAVAVVCDACVEQQRTPTHACASYPAAPERVLIESLTEPFDHRTPHD